MTTNTVTLVDNQYVYAVYKGDQTYASVYSSSQRTEGFLKTLRSQCKPVLLLVNLNAIGKIDIKARQVGAELLKSMDYDRVAIYGRDLFNKILVNFIIFAANRTETVRYFSDEIAARAWLFASKIN